MMKRTSFLLIALGTLTAAALAFVGRDLVGRGPDRSGSDADSVWYHESNVALLAKTGRPQLVEFFHPG